MEYKINALSGVAEAETLFEESLASLLHAASNDLDPWERQKVSFWFAKNGIGIGLRVISLMGWDLPEQSPMGVGQLFWAARGGDADCILLSANAIGYEQRDVWNGTALHHWAEAKGSKISAGAHVLLGLGLDPMRRDCWGMLPMHWGSDEGVWAWGMAAAWAKGEPEAWRSCGIYSSKTIMSLVHAGVMADWVQRMGMAHSSRSLERRFLSSASIALIESVPDELQVSLVQELAQRVVAIGKISDEQNCIARMLGIESLARQFNFLE